MEKHPILNFNDMLSMKKVQISIEVLNQKNILVQYKACTSNQQRLFVSLPQDFRICDQKVLNISISLTQQATNAAQSSGVRLL